MNYDRCRAAWREALNTAGLLPFAPWSTETIDLGRLYLSSVELLGWQRVDLPRAWDDPDHEQDPEPVAQLVDFAGRMREALQVWGDSLRHLQPPAPRQPRNTPRR